MIKPGYLIGDKRTVSMIRCLDPHLATVIAIVEANLIGLIIGTGRTNLEKHKKLIVTGLRGIQDTSDPGQETARPIDMIETHNMATMIDAGRQLKLDQTMPRFSPTESLSGINYVGTLLADQKHFSIHPLGLGVVVLLVISEVA